jgi:predicted RNA-binding Zn ribbon-like protein
LPGTHAPPPTAASTPLEGGHPALDLVNTIWGQVGGPVEHDVLAAPEDLVVLTARLGLARPGDPASAGALRDARELRAGLDAVLRDLLAGRPPRPAARETVAGAARAALAAAHLAPGDDGVLGWTWPSRDPRAPVHRLALPAVELLTSPDDLGRLRACEGCRWLFLDRSRGAGRRWCSMAYCGTDAKKRRYVERRRERRAAAARPPS